MPAPAKSPQREEILSRAKAHRANQPIRKLDVPEWDCTIYWTSMTLDEREAVMNRTRNSGFAEAQAFMICLKALDVDGLKIFDADDKRVFRTLVDSDIVTRIATAIGNDDKTLDQRIEDAEKN